ncbi:MAG TPA: hypothetical protein VGO55_01410 [Allosphingosinicella sp.]|nr:hypothetical protein [Allosphingosinicella sp.]
MKMDIRGSLRISGGLDLSDFVSNIGHSRHLMHAFPSGIPRRHAKPRQVSENLAKLFPAEAAAAYPLAIGAASDSFALRIVLIAVIALSVILYRYFATQPKGGGRPDFQAIFISLVSFLLWATSLGGFGVLLETRERTTMLASFASILWLGFVAALPSQEPQATSLKAKAEGSKPKRAPVKAKAGPAPAKQPKG